MRYTDTFRGGIHTAGVYLYKNKQIALTKNDKEYGNLIMQDRTGTIDTEIWDLGSPGVGKFETMDYVHVEADVTLFQNSFQLNVCRIHRAQEGEYVKAGRLPVSKKDIRKMYEELLGYIRGMKNPYLQELLCGCFVGSVASAKAFQFHSAAKTMHHGFVGDLLKHTLNVTRLCDYYAGYYPMINHDLLLTATVLHDTGKAREFSRFPKNDYTDNGQLLDHIIIGTEMMGENICSIPEFLEKLATEPKCCVLTHHGGLEYGSPKKPTLLEALALSFADNTDARVETMIEALRSGGDNRGRLGYNRPLESNIRKATE